LSLDAEPYLEKIGTSPGDLVAGPGVLFDLLEGSNQIGLKCLELLGCGLELRNERSERYVNPE
jgi:hypothetical protein